MALFFLILALVCFLVCAFVPVGRVNLLAVGLASLTVYFLLPALHLLH